MHTGTVNQFYTNVYKFIFSPSVTSLVFLSLQNEIKNGFPVEHDFEQDSLNEVKFA